jgi:hypothetical protein
LRSFGSFLQAPATKTDRFSSLVRHDNFHASQKIDMVWP